MLTCTSIIKRSKLSDLPFYNCIKNAVFVATLEGYILDANEALISFLGVPIDTIQRHRFLSFLANECSAQFMEYLEHQVPIKEAKVIIKDAHGVLHQGYLSLSFMAYPEEGILVHGVIDVPIQQICREQVTQQAPKMAATVRLVSNLAHEIRNPLGNILLGLEQLALDEQNQEQQYFLQMIRRNSYRINELIDELLYASSPAECY